MPGLGSRRRCKFCSASGGCHFAVAVTFAVPAVEPQMSDVLVIDGAEHFMKDLRPLPVAGTPVAFVAG